MPNLDSREIKLVIHCLDVVAERYEDTSAKLDEKYDGMKHLFGVNVSNIRSIRDQFQAVLDGKAVTG